MFFYFYSLYQTTIQRKNKVLLEQQLVLEKSISELIVRHFDKMDSKFDRTSSDNINNLSMIREKMSLIDRAQQNITSLTENAVDLKNFLANTTQEEGLEKYSLKILSKIIFLKTIMSFKKLFLIIHELIV